MTEDFIHYLWQNKLFLAPLITQSGEHLEVINPGFHNHNAGPDFSNARLRIGETLWAGNVEIHINASDWFKHGHQNDEAYASVVLHVVLNDDLNDKLGIPTCEIAGKFDDELHTAYKRFISSMLFVPCINHIKEISETEKVLWLERMLIEKLEHKADFIHSTLGKSFDDWEEALYHLIARSFGFSVNSLPFEILARSLPYRVLARHANNLMQVEALVFGQAGMLTQSIVDPWGQTLFNEYSFLRKKYKLVPISSSMWHFLRLRPVNFPTIRLSQFAMFISENVGLLARTISMNSIDEMMDLFKIKTSAYWETHYTFDKPSTTKEKWMGKDAARLIVINAILPFIFVYGRTMANDELCNNTLALLEQLPGEKNTITSQWRAGGMDVKTAYSTQALMELKTSYCDKRKCLNCRIGNNLIKNPSFIYNFAN